MFLITRDIIKKGGGGRQMTGRVNIYILHIEVITH